MVATGVECLVTAWAAAAVPSRCDDHPSPLAEGKGKLIAAEARSCWHPEVEQCGHRAVVQLPGWVKGGPVPVTAPGRSLREITLVRGRSGGTSPRQRFHYQRELISGRQVPQGGRRAGATREVSRELPLRGEVVLRRRPIAGELRKRHECRGRLLARVHAAIVVGVAGLLEPRVPEELLAVSEDLERA